MFDSTATRSYYGARTRPHSFCGGGHVPLSISSPFLTTDDPMAAALLARSEAAAEAQEGQKRRMLMSQRADRREALARRKAERETFENYVQTPFAQAKGTKAMKFGVNVIDGGNSSKI